MAASQGLITFRATYAFGGVVGHARDPVTANSLASLTGDALSRYKYRRC
jgi:hypothetical protein